MGLQQILDRFQEFSDKFDHGAGQYSAERVAQRKEYHAFVRATDYLSVEEFETFNLPYAGRKLPKFTRYAPANQPEGYYKIGLFGYLSRRSGNWEGYLPTWQYLLYQLRLTWSFASGAANGMSLEFSLVGLIVAILTTIVLVLAGLAIRLPVGLLLTFIQFFVKTFRQIH